MPSTFKAKIYKVGINPCVKVPKAITNEMTPMKGYIRVKGKIENHSFTQTLVSVRGEGYRLYVNGPMLKGASVTLGDTVTFSLEQNNAKKEIEPMPVLLRKALDRHKVIAVFNALSLHRQKEIKKYLNNLKSKEAVVRNVARIIAGLKGEQTVSLFRL